VPGAKPHPSVIPAKAGTHEHGGWREAKAAGSVLVRQGSWVPAYAGMTVVPRAAAFGERGRAGNAGFKFYLGPTGSSA
jgi:hypothetical protein